MKIEAVTALSTRTSYTLMELELAYLESHPHLSSKVTSLIVTNSIGRSPAARLQALSNVQHISYIRSGRKFVVGDLAALKHAPKLRSLDIVGVCLTSKDVVTLSALNLRHLALIECGLEGVNMAPLSKLPLTSLEIRCRHVERWFRDFIHSKPLVELRIAVSFLDANSLELDRITSLRVLELEWLSQRVDLSTLPLSSLEKLSLPNIGYTNPSVLSLCSNLKALGLSISSITSVPFDLPIPKSVTSLHFKDAKIYESCESYDVEHLSFSKCEKSSTFNLPLFSRHITRVTHLNLREVFSYPIHSSYREIMDNIEGLELATQLQSLNLRDNSLYDDCTKVITQLENLHILDLRHNRLTSDCLPELAEHPTLTSLSLDDNGIKDYSGLYPNTLITNTQDKYWTIPQYDTLLERNRSTQEALCRLHNQYFLILSAMYLKG